MTASTEQLTQAIQPRLEILSELLSLANREVTGIKTQITNGAIKPSMHNGQQHANRQATAIRSVGRPRGRKPAARAAQARQASTETWVIPKRGPYAGKTYEEAQVIKAKQSASQKRRYSQKRSAAPTSGTFNRMTGQTRNVGRPRKQAAA